MRLSKAVFWFKERESIRIALVFIFSIFALFLLLSIEPVYLYTVEPLTMIIAWLSSGIFKLLGTPIRAEKTALLWMEGSKYLFSIDIKDGCNGLYPTIIFLAAILAQPATWRKRMLGFLIGFPAIFVVNLIRVISLFYIGYYWNQEALHVAHIYVWQTLIIFFAVLIWLFWVDRFIKPRRANSK